MSKEGLKECARIVGERNIEIAQLKVRISQLEHDKARWYLLSDTAASAARISELEAALLKYGQHNFWKCDSVKIMTDVKIPKCPCINCEGEDMEVGPFVFDGTNSLQSDDFAHDVRITFNGDMLPGDYERYGEWLTKVLNAATACTSKAES